MSHREKEREREIWWKGDSEREGLGWGGGNQRAKKETKEREKGEKATLTQEEALPFHQLLNTFVFRQSVQSGLRSTIHLRMTLNS